MHRHTPAKKVKTGITKVPWKGVDNVRRADLNGKDQANTPAHMKYCGAAPAVVQERVASLVIHGTIL
jgi:hypothetical protein